MPAQQLFQPFRLKSLELKNRMVMAPMTRSFSPGGVPASNVADYYARRAAGEVGLIVSEGTVVNRPASSNDPNIPRFYGEQPLRGWKAVIDKVHAAGGVMAPQLWHMGVVAPRGSGWLPPAPFEGPSGYVAPGKIGGVAMTEHDIAETIRAFAQAAREAKALGFDAVEIHGAHGYLIDQFFWHPTNQRTDRYGGSIENRARFVLEVADAAIRAIGRDKVGIRLSPFGVFNDMPVYAAMAADYTYLARELNALGLAYIHLVDHSPMGAPPVPDSMKATFRSVFKGALILSGGYDAARAESDLAAGKCDLVAVGRPFLANPDLVTRLERGLPLNAPDFATFYTPGPKGYTDYPTAS